MKFEKPQTARFFTVVQKAIRCTLCPHNCCFAPKDGSYGTHKGLCGTRTHAGSVLELPYYGYITALSMDPIEKKPLYHWRPGSVIASVGFAGCNLRCPFCQNWHISQITGGKAPAPCTRLNPEELAAAVKAAYTESGRAGQPVSAERQIAYTYSEPLVHAEYLIDCMTEARTEKTANILVTNGCANGEAAEAVLGLTDAANIDLKCFSEKTYNDILGGNLPAVLDFIRLAVSLGVHTEITTLVVPGLNDSETELAEIAEFIAGLNKDIAWHLCAYHPDWKWKAPPTDSGSLSAAVKRARAILPYVYSGNIAGEENNTQCRRCNQPLVQRSGYRINADNISPGEKGFYCCASCGELSPIRQSTRHTVHSVS